MFQLCKLFYLLYYLCTTAAYLTVNKWYQHLILFRFAPLQIDLLNLFISLKFSQQFLFLFTVRICFVHMQRPYFRTHFHWHPFLRRNGDTWLATHRHSWDIGVYSYTKVSVFGVWKTNDRKLWPGKNGFAHDIHVSWLYYRDIKIRDTFVYKHILVGHARR